jgi:hypothetical protein
MISVEGGAERSMQRRSFIGLIGGGLAAWPFEASAQRAPHDKKRRIGFITLDNPDTQFFLGALTDGLRELGYGERELRFEVRSAQDSAELLGLAAELLALKVEVMFAFLLGHLGHPDAAVRCVGFRRQSGLKSGRADDVGL